MLEITSYALLRPGLKYIIFLSNPMFYLLWLCLGAWLIERKFFQHLVILAASTLLLNTWITHIIQLPSQAGQTILPFLDHHSVPSADMQVMSLCILAISLHYQRWIVWIAGISILTLTCFAKIILHGTSPYDLLDGFLFGTGFYGLYLAYIKTDSYFFIKKHPNLQCFIAISALLYAITTYPLYTKAENLVSAGLILGVLFSQRLAYKLPLQNIPFFSSKIQKIQITSICCLSLLIIFFGLDLYARKQIFQPHQLFLLFTSIGVLLFWLHPWLIDKWLKLNKSQLFNTKVAASPQKQIE